MFVNDKKFNIPNLNVTKQLLFDTNRILIGGRKISNHTNGSASSILEANYEGLMSSIIFFSIPSSNYPEKVFKVCKFFHKVNNFYFLDNLIDYEAIFNNEFQG